MNKSELVDAIAERTGVSKSDVDYDLRRPVRGRGRRRRQGRRQGDDPWVRLVRAEPTVRPAPAATPPPGETIQVAATNTAKVSAGSKLKAIAAGKEPAPQQLTRPRSQDGLRVRPSSDRQRSRARWSTAGLRWRSMAAHPKPGDKAPAFNLTDQHGDKIRLSVVQGPQGARVLLPEGRHARLHHPGVRRCATSPATIGDTVILGISPDPPAKLAKFDEKYGLGFPLLSDPDHAVAEAYGVWGEKSMYGKRYHGLIRSAFLIDETGKVSHAWPKISPKDTPTKLLGRSPRETDRRCAGRRGAADGSTVAAHQPGWRNRQTAIGLQKPSVLRGRAGLDVPAPGTDGRMANGSAMAIRARWRADPGVERDLGAVRGGDHLVQLGQVVDRDGAGRCDQLGHSSMVPGMFGRSLDGRPCRRAWR